MIPVFLLSCFYELLVIAQNLILLSQSGEKGRVTFSVVAFFFVTQKFSKVWYLSNQREVVCHFVNSEGCINHDTKELYINFQI
jgi:hypothetical protein